VSQSKFVLEGLHGPRNLSVDARAARAIRQKLEDAGVLFPARIAQSKHFNCVAEWLGFFPFDKDLDVLEELDEPDLHEKIKQVERDIASL
jgi:hypothetical protein